MPSKDLSTLDPRRLNNAIEYPKFKVDESNISPKLNILKSEAGEVRLVRSAQNMQAAKSRVLENANFSQKTYSEVFSIAREARFAGQTIDDVAGALQSGQLRPVDVPIQYIVRDGNTLILNTRSAQALERAGIPRSQWNAVNLTGDVRAEERLTRQLQRNGLTIQGTPTVTSNGDH